jgi:hypothetical protein
VEQAAAEVDVTDRRLETSLILGAVVANRDNVSQDCCNLHAADVRYFAASAASFRHSHTAIGGGLR